MSSWVEAFSRYGQFDGMRVLLRGVGVGVGFMLEIADCKAFLLN